ncbi:BnaCnng47860D [Brassica napus]|uniref:MADS-box domain-containing protein n=2 Tax=Brassica TaxID=3705 RepID=A0A0D3BZX9_BRAOL|nr:unnamed protein product [Brassica napus]CDY65583.1 BnaCnng47860D [Brassica napus]
MRSPRPSSCSESSSSSSSSSTYSLAPTSLNSRLLTIFKKAQELTTLSDIEACVIHYGPDGELRTWPENRDIVRDLALRYIQLDEAKRRKKNVNLYEFLNKNKDKKKMANNFKKKAKKNVEELKYPISDHYSPDEINQLIHSLELSYSTLQERRRFLAAKKHNESLNPSQFTPYHKSLAVQKSGLHYQLMPYVGGYDQSMCMGNNFQDPCLSNIQDYSVIPLELQESVSNYELNQLMPHELLWLGSKHDLYSGFMVDNPSFPQDFNPDMSSSYVDENRLLQASTLPSL